MVLTGRRFEGIKAVYSLGGRVTVATFSDFNSDIRITIKYNIFLRRAHKTVIRLRPKLDRVKKKKKLSNWRSVRTLLGTKTLLFYC